MALVRGRAFVVIFGLILTVVPSGSSLPTDDHIEGEDGSPLVEGCSLDGETAAAFPDYMFFPSEGCTATYILRSLGGLAGLSARVRVGGQDEVCGSLVLSGALTGSSDPFCLPAGGWYEVAVIAYGHAGAFSVTWLPDPLTTPPWTNADLDRLTVLALA